MLAAELAGKITGANPPHDRMEDVLTSNVLSSFRYLNNLVIVKEFLKRAARINGKVLELDELVEFEAYFWPQFRFSHTGHRQPDAVLFAIDSKGNTIAFIVEAKLDSGLHNADNAQSREDSDEKFTLGHQLADQFCGLRCGIWRNAEITEKLDRADKKYLIYLTAHYSCPQQDMETAISEIYDRNKSKGCAADKCHDAEDWLLWLSWQDLYVVLERTRKEGYSGYSRGERALLLDLEKVLGRKELMPLALWENSLREVTYYEGNYDGEQPSAQVEPEIDFLHTASLHRIPRYQRNYA